MIDIHDKNDMLRAAAIALVLAFAAGVYNIHAFSEPEPLRPELFKGNPYIKQLLKEAMRQGGLRAWEKIDEICLNESIFRVKVSSDGGNSYKWVTYKCTAVVEI